MRPLAPQVRLALGIGLAAYCPLGAEAILGVPSPAPFVIDTVAPSLAPSGPTVTPTTIPTQKPTCTGKNGKCPELDDSPFVLIVIVFFVIIVGFPCPSPPCRSHAAHFSPRHLPPLHDT